MPIPFHHFGGQGPLVHIGHANSFPPGMYKEMVQPLLGDFTVIGMESRGLWPAADTNEVFGWEQMSLDLIAFFDENDWRQVHVIGHSLGAAKIIFAALRRPELFDKVVLIEPPFLPKWIFNLSALIPADWRRRVIPPSRVANNRTDKWKDTQAFFDYIRPKKVFSRIPDSILWDYVRHVQQEIEDGVALRYTKEWESHTYASLQSPWEALKQMNHQTLAIRGFDSDIISLRSWKRWQQAQSNTIFDNIDGGGHLIPFEQPGLVGERILRFLKKGQ